MPTGHTPTRTVPGRTLSFQLGTGRTLPFPAGQTWREAWASCEQQGADLLSITEIHEQTYINGEAGAVGSGRDPKTCPHL